MSNVNGRSMGTPHGARRDVAVELSLAEGLFVSLQDFRPEAVSLFTDLAEDHRRALASDAWQIGLRALGNAYSQARESKLEDVGKALVGDVERELRAHLDRQFSTMEAVLKRYFDPSEGEIKQRLAEFLADEGVLHRVLEEHVGGDRSVLSETLARHVGEHSELFRRLSPSDKNGVIHQLEERVRGVLEHNQQALLLALDPLAENGAVAKLLRTLRKELEDAQAQGGRLLQKAVAALDANDETSALSRLIRETREAQNCLVRALHPEAPDSPLAAVRRTVQTLLEAHGQSQQKLLEDQRERQKELEAYIRETVARMEARKSVEARSPRGGATFEDAVIAFITEMCGDTYIVEPTGSSPGRRKGCKVGDAVIRFGNESAFAGCRVVVEAKHAGHYTAAKMLEEMELARENREAQVGIFVLSRSHAWAGASEFTRYGSTIFVLWDAEDGATDAQLKAAVLAALAMATRRRTDADTGDIKALRDVEKRIQQEVDRIHKMRSENKKIADASDSIGEELRKADRKLATLLEKAKRTLVALSVELIEEEVELQSPIRLPVDGHPSSERARMPGADELRPST